VLFEGADFPKNPPVDESRYILWGHAMDRVYQLAARWVLMQPYLAYLQERKAMDVRGFYFLSRIADLEQELAQWSQLSSEKQTQYREWLTDLCYNSKGLGQDCTQELSSQIAANDVVTYYKTYQQAGQDTWDYFFAIPTQRTDVQWTLEQNNVMKVPFLIPDSDKILSFLRDNIEDEWRTATWNLRLDFQKSAHTENIPHLSFAPGVTPHVNAIAGNIITMDQNAPLDEWDVRWTIRHEFGHVLGFLDCYLEYYDPNEKAITSYQFDLTNLMCSRQGKFQTQHFETLKKAYLK
jgi:hypothetical protein